uniref:Uncharacterized protein n=1 Tax=Pristionchus pacificus TaxID=54126 RepID=A0A2A6BYX6_PRIPA|eukprot:PDM71088.1 hypothetical protein PRIPAC_44486 [Pristionchus pacificus]
MNSKAVFWETGKTSSFRSDVVEVVFDLLLGGALFAKNRSIGLDPAEWHSIRAGAAAVESEEKPGSRGRGRSRTNEYGMIYRS